MTIVFIKDENKYPKLTNMQEITQYVHFEFKVFAHSGLKFPQK